MYPGLEKFSSFSEAFEALQITFHSWTDDRLYSKDYRVCFDKIWDKWYWEAAYDEKEIRDIAYKFQTGDFYTLKEACQYVELLFGKNTEYGVNLEALRRGKGNCYGWTGIDLFIYRGKPGKVWRVWQGKKEKLVFKHGFKTRKAAVEALLNFQPQSVS